MPAVLESSANPREELATRYAEVQRLGGGAEGGTWSAREAGGARVVLKPVGPDRLPAVRHAFTVLRGLASPHLPAPRELWTAPSGTTWLVTDWIEGAPLEPGPVAPHEALGDALACAHALAAIHRAGTHHGDVSLANAIRTPTRGCVLVDLAQLGRLGTGTPGFIAPEVLAGGGGPAADRFALGSLLCARLFGAPPWQRPEALLAVRGHEAVRARLVELARGHDVGEQVLELLVRLLDPDPARRGDDDEALSRRLLHLHAIAQAQSRAPLDRASAGFATRWSIPARWPYRGVDPDAVIEALRGELAPRLVVVVGAPHSGRTRFVEELVQRLQSDGRGPVAQLGDARSLADRGGWLEAWLAGALPAVLGLRETPPLVAAPLAQQAATLAAAAALATSALVLPVDLELGQALEALAGPRLAIVKTRPWTRDELDGALADVVDVDRSGWVDAVLELTGGWSARAVRTIAAAARAGLERPDRGALAGLAAGDDDELDDALAQDVLVASWTRAPEVLARIPAQLRDAEGPWIPVVAAARARIGGDVQSLAREQLAAARAGGRTIGLALALAADDAAQIEAVIAAAPPQPGSPDAAAWIDWLAVAPTAAIGPTHWQAATRSLLRDGQPERALELARRGGTAPQLRLEAARALQRLGRADEALRELDGIAVPAHADDESHLRALGLRVRVLVDLGRVDDACAVIEGDGVGAPRHGLGWATVMLWIGYAELARARRTAAERALAGAAAALDGSTGSEADGARARAIQLLGNLAHERGDLALAAARWSEAAAAFARAGEPVGLALLRGSLAALAIPTFGGATGIDHGRAAVRGLLARGQLDALATAALNLVQLLARHGLRDEALALGHTVEHALGPWAPASARARARRVAAENAALACTSSAAPRELAQRWAAARAAFDQAAHQLGAAGLHAEASEAHVRAAACGRRAGRLDVASTALAAAQLEATRAGDDDPWRVEVERRCWAAAHRDRGRAGTVGELADAERLEAWLRTGQLERAWATTRVGWTVACLRHDRGDPARRAALAPLLRTIEVIMDKTPSSDRNAVRTSLWADAERDALRELADELGGEPHARSAAPAPAPAADLGRTERLLRIHRRLAREDRLEPLLEQVIDAVMELTDAERGAIVVREQGGGRREVTRELGHQGQGMQFSRSVIERVMEGGEPVLSVDAAADDRFDGSRSISHLNLRSVLAVALRFRGEVLGAIYVDHRLRRGNFDEHDLAHVEEFAELAALAVAHARALAEVRSQADRLAAQHAQLSTLLDAREVEVAGLRARVAEGGKGGDRHGIIGNTAAMERCYKLVDRLADTDVPVVIYGESGTGKELIARAIHRGGSRRDGPFIAENCGAIPETLLESVLFGHARGAFTGADKAKPGLFEAASGGTIFLDEVGETSPAMQTKLLRVLQEGEVRRIGENQARPVDVRVIAASNRDLDAMVEQGKFRRDLYYRIHVVRIALPPLRERRDDIAALVEHFLARYGAKQMRVTPATMRALASHAWPGNVRELENEVQRWIALCDGDVQPEDLSFSIRGAETTVDPDDLRIRPRVDRLERDLIARALERSRNNQTKAAELLGLSRFGLQKKLRKLEAPGEPEPDPDAGSDDT